MRIPSPGELAPNGQPLPDRRYKTNVSDILGFDLGNLDQNNLNVADVLKSEVISWFRYNLNYNAYANIGMPTVFIPKSQKRKVQYPLKRINYRRYKNANWSWKDIFIEIDNKIGYLHPDIIRKLE
jgi:hypothetical protein